MASEILAIKAASGLVSLMANKPASGAIKDSTVAQISAALFYKTNVMAKLASNSEFQSAFRNVIFDQLEVDFGDYIDAKSRTSPKSFHHVYEWGRIGDDEARLFKLKKFEKSILPLNLLLDRKRCCNILKEVVYICVGICNKSRCLKSISLLFV